MRSDAVLFERDIEIDLVRRAVDRVHASGSGRMILFTGQPGIGKTSLLAAAQATAGGGGMRVATACGLSLEADCPWGLVRQLFDPLLAVIPRDGAAAAGAALLSGAESAVGPPQGEYGLIHSLLWLTAGLAAEGPLLLVADDLQWADLASLRFLAYLAARLPGMPVMVVGATRPVTERVEHIVSAIASQPRTDVHELRPFTPAATGYLLARVLGRPPGSDLAERCHEVTRGNPLLVRELGRHVARAGSGDEVEQVFAGRIPAVDQYVRAELARLPEPARTTARALAVLGDRASAARIATVADLPVEAALEGLSLLQANELVTGTGSPPLFSVSHPLVGAAIYEAMTDARRAVFHIRAARAAARAHDPERAATHLLRVPAGVADLDAAGILAAAADRCLARGSVDAAVAFLGRRLDEDLGAGRLEALARLGMAEALVDTDRAEAHLSEALTLESDPEGSANLALGLAVAMFSAGKPVDILRVLRTTLDRHAPRLSTGTQRALQAWILMLVNMTPTGQDPHRLAQRFAALPADPSAGALMLDGVLALMNCVTNRRDDARTHALRAIADGALITDMLAESPLSSAWLTLVACDSPEVLASIDAGVDAARRAGSLRTFAPAACYRAAYMLSRGNLLEAVTDGQAAWEASRAGFIDVGLNFVGAHLIPALVESGRLDEAETACQQLRTEGAPLPRYIDAGGELSFLVATGRIDEAMAVIDTTREHCRLFSVSNPVVCDWRGFLVRCLHARHRIDEARAVAAENIELARAWGTHRAVGRALRVAAVVETGSTQIDLLTAAVETLGDTGATLELAHAHHSLGDALRRARRSRDGAAHLQAALELAERCGAEPLRVASARQLRMVGVRPRTGSRLGPDALTPGERRVVDLAADGLPNRDIAQQLYVTTKTVEVHLSNAFRKLGIAGRRELRHALDG